MKTRFVGTVTDISYMHSLFAQDVPMTEKVQHLRNIRDPGVGIFDEIFTLARWQDCRVYMDEVLTS